MKNEDIRALIARLEAWDISGDYPQCRQAAHTLSLLLDVKTAAEQIDIWLKGEDLYEGSWINYPQQPEQSPALVNRKALKAVEDA